MTFIVAEIGVNWDGDLKLLKDMLSHAKLYGFDAVKFQAFNENNVKDHPEKSRLMESSITDSNIKKIDSLAKQIGIEWFATPMYKEAVSLLDPYVEKFKIRVSDGRTIFSNTTELVECVLKTGKEIMISVEKPPPQNFVNNKKIKWLYCVSKYPCSFSDLDFTNIKYYNGFSNHCPKIIAPLKAFILGAEIIEIHVTSNITGDFFDNNVSFDYAEQEILLQYMHESRQISN